MLFPSGMLFPPADAKPEHFAMANTLAKEGTSMKLFGPETFLPNTDTETMQQRWHNTTDCVHTKGFINSPDINFTKKLL